MTEYKRINQGEFNNYLLKIALANLSQKWLLTEQGVSRGDPRFQECYQIEYALEDIVWTYSHGDVIQLDLNELKEIWQNDRLVEIEDQILVTNIQISSQKLVKIYRDNLIARRAFECEIGYSNPNFNYRIKILETILQHFAIPFAYLRFEISQKRYQEVVGKCGVIEYQEVKENEQKRR